MNVTDEFMFGIRTFGGSIRVNMEGCFKLIFTYEDTRIDEDRLMAQTFPNEDFAFEPPMPVGWPSSQELKDVDLGNRHQPLQMLFAHSTFESRYPQLVMPRRR